MGWTDSSGAHSADYGKSDRSMYPDKADVARKVEQSRFRQIMAHPRVKNGTAFNLGIWIATETDMEVVEAHAMLDKAVAGDDSKVHRPSRQAPAPPQYAPAEAARVARINSELAKANAKAERDYMAANGYIDRRTDAERQRDISLARFAHDALASRGEAEYRLNPGDEAELANLGFGAAKSNENLYAAGAASAARLLGKPAPQAGPAHSYVTESRSPVIGTASDDDALYAADADAARKLYSMKPVRDEINADLRHKWAEQQRNRR